MGHSANTRESLIDKHSGYLYFASPEQLWVGDSAKEQHIEILESSGRGRSEVTVAGYLSNFDKGEMVIVNGDGSRTINFPSVDPSPVAEFIRNFPRMNRSNVSVRYP